MNKNKINLYIMVITIFIITSCHNKNSNYDWLPSCKNNNEEIIYFKFSQKLLTYNTENYKVVQQNDTPNFFQFTFNKKSNYYTSGHSIDNGFKLLHIDNNKINVIYEAEKNEGIFPLATDGDMILFLRCFYDNSGKEIYEKRCVASFNTQENEFDKYNNITGLISFGDIIHETLYYTEYKPDSDTFSLFKINLHDFNAIPHLLETGLKKGEIYTSSDKLWKYDGEYIFNETSKFKTLNINTIDNKTDNLISIGIDNQDCLYIQVTDIINNDMYIKVNDIIDYKIKNNTIYIYGNGFIKKYSLH